MSDALPVGRVPRATTKADVQAALGELLQWVEDNFEGEDSGPPAKMLKRARQALEPRVAPVVVVTCLRCAVPVGAHTLGDEWIVDCETCGAAVKAPTREAAFDLWQRTVPKCACGGEVEVSDHLTGYSWPAVLWQTRCALECGRTSTGDSRLDAIAARFSKIWRDPVERPEPDEPCWLRLPNGKHVRGVWREDDLHWQTGSLEKHGRPLIDADVLGWRPAERRRKD